MDNRKYNYLHTFNNFAELLRFGDLINSYCQDVEDCERTLDAIKCVVERMTRMIKLMEE